MAPPSRLIDVSVRLVQGIQTYPGNPEFLLEPVQRIADGASSNVSRLVMATHAGTHIDAPRHFFDEGDPVDALPLDLLIGKARVVEITRTGGIGSADLADLGLGDDVRLLLKTPNSALWATPAFQKEYTHLTGDGARYLVDKGVKVVGIDYLSIERFKAPGAPAHRTLLSSGVIIIEGLNLTDAAPGTYALYCLPLRVAGADGAPARVVLES